MTPNQRIFADEYIKTRNATRAYLIAYPDCKKESSASTASSRMLRNVEIRDYIKQKINKITENSSIADAKEIMLFYTSVIRGETEEQQMTVKGSVVQTRSRTSDRINAARALSKMLGIDNGLEREKFDLERRIAETEETSNGMTESIIEAVKNV